MDTKKFVITSIVAFVAFLILDSLVHMVLLKGAYKALEHLWRADMMSMYWISILIGLVMSFLFVYIFVKGREGKGVAEGARFGIIIGLFMMLPSAFGQYFVYPIPFSLALQWFIYGMIEYIIVGMVVAALYKPKV